jgi:membrane-bound lytic murein transglycosylase D
VLVEPGETLTHFATWLQVPSDRLRRLNGLRPSTPLEVGRRVRLDFSQVSRETFDTRRRQHHEAVRAEFFASYRVAGTSRHVLRPGDSWWSLSRQHQTVPLWLLRQYNPHLDGSGLRPGVEVQIPVVEKKST